MDDEEEEGDDDMAVPGVRGLDHTADLGLRIDASDLSGVFRRAAHGLLHLVMDGDPFPAGIPEGLEERTVSLSAEDLPSLLREWLREVLHWSQDEGWALADCSVRSVTGTRLEVRVRGGRSRREPVREIKGVTLHGLRLERSDGGWTGRVIFDV